MIMTYVSLIGSLLNMLNITLRMSLNHLNNNHQAVTLFRRIYSFLDSVVFSYNAHEINIIELSALLIVSVLDCYVISPENNIMI